eukprot:3915512-Amphidinium_carterae.1
MDDSRSIRSLLELEALWIFIKDDGLATHFPHSAETSLGHLWLTTCKSSARVPLRLMQLHASDKVTALGLQSKSFPSSTWDICQDTSMQ